MAARACAYCGLPARARDEASPAFCCIGCRIAAAAGASPDAKRGFMEARLLIASFLAMGIMTFSLVLYSERVYGIEPDRGMEMVRTVGRYLLAVLALPVFLLLGVPLLRGARADLRQGRIRMDGLIVLATVAAFALSVIHTIDGSGEVYYETATMVLVLVTFGRRLEAHARSRGRDAAAALMQELPEEVDRIGSGGLIERVPRGSLRAGDRVQVAPGSKAGADLRVLKGSGSVILAHITGEYAPVPVEEGSEVPSGAVNGDALLLGEVLRTAEDGSLGRIRALLDAPLPATRSLRMVDTLAGVLAAVAICLALAAAIREGAAGNPDAALRTSLSVLLVACPCALGLATPLAFRAMRAALAKQGVLVHDAVAMETAPRVGVVLLDKTGTLTDPDRGELEWIEGDAGAAERTRALLRASGHPLGRLVREAVAPVAELRAVPGSGVEGVVDGVAGRAGRPEWLFPEADRIPAAWPLRPGSGDGSLVGGVFSDGSRCLLEARQQLRAGAADAVRSLRSLGLDVEILSGDRPGAVEAVAGMLGAPARAALRPGDKVARIREHRSNGALVLMAGDGVNDGPALRASDVSVAMAEGTALARSEAQVELAGATLAGLPAFIEGARLLRRTVRGNLFWTVSYNGVAVALAYSGMLHPLAAVGAMIASSLIISLRSARLLDFAGAPAGAPAPGGTPAVSEAARQAPGLGAASS